MPAVMIMAYDERGEIRFVGDVPKGAACRCVCPTCASPLVARQGQENEWHFAHEASQERPECAVGAMNLARTLGIEYLRRLHASGRLVLPPYNTHAAVSSAWFAHSQSVTWESQLVGPLTWIEAPAKANVVATGQLDTGAAMAFFVQVGETSAPSMDGLPPDTAYATLLVAPTWPRGTRTREEALAAIAETARLHWGYQPDSFGMRGRAQRELEAMEARERARYEQIRHHRATEAGRRWAEIARKMDQGHAPPAPDHASAAVMAPSTGSAHAGPPGNAPAPPTATRRTSQEGTRYPEYPGHQNSCNFQFFRLDAEQAWVFYPLEAAFLARIAERDQWEAPPPPKAWAIAPAHRKFDGWDECLPPSVGTALPEEGIYLVRDHITAVVFLSPRSKGSASAHDPAEFLGK